jgi:hypothetical protein
MQDEYGQYLLIITVILLVGLSLLFAVLKGL